MVKNLEVDFAYFMKSEIVMPSSQIGNFRKTIIIYIFKASKLFSAILINININIFFNQLSLLIPED